MDLVLHIGAHRTGSTMVAQSMAATIAAHPTCGVALWGPRRLRDIPGFQAATRRLNEQVEPVDKPAAIALDRLASFLAREAAIERTRGVKTLILSEENFIGGMRNNLQTGVFYPEVFRRLASFDSLLPMSPIRVALGVREYGAVWTSAHHYQPQSRRVAAPVEHAKIALLYKIRGWPKVIKAAQNVWPDASFLMWQQEHLAKDAARICARIMGLEADQIVMPKGKVNARKSKTSRPAVFNEDERLMLAKRYKRHIRKLREDKTINWVGGPAS